MHVTTDEFVTICYDHAFDIKAIQTELTDLGNGIGVTAPVRIRGRIANLRRKGILPMESGNKVQSGEILKGTSTNYGPDGEIRQQWVKTDVPKQEFLEAFQTAIHEISTTIKPLPASTPPLVQLDEELATLYISNDVHFGALMWGEEVEEDYNTDIATTRLKAAYDYLFDCSPSTKIGIVTDLGDLLEVDSFSNFTPKSGNPLDVDSRYPKILRAAYESLIYGVQKALAKHELVYFYNIEGNHDISSGIAIREIIRMVFKDEPRVIVDDSPTSIKYHQHGATLLGFAHGDNLKMSQAAETMAHDCRAIWSETQHRFFHFGHNHKHSVIDTKLCKCESHRNLAPLNDWAYSNGYRRGIGTMSSITYSSVTGEKSRQLYSVAV